MASSLFMPSRVPYFALLLFCALTVELECVHHCLTAQKLCSHDTTCSALFYFVNENCGNHSESEICTAKDALSCKAALKALQNHEIFHTPCICTDEASQLGLQCHQLYNYIFKNPCLTLTEADSSSEVWTKEGEDDLLRAPSCTYAFKICFENQRCKQMFEFFKRHCRVVDGECRPINRVKCEEAVSGIQLTPMYGCSCWNTDERCEKIHQLINDNSCIVGHRIYQPSKIPPLNIHKVSKDNPLTLSPPSTELSNGDPPETEPKQTYIYSDTLNPSMSRVAPDEDKTVSSGSSTVRVSSNKEMPIYTNNNAPSITEKQTERVSLPSQDSAQLTVVTSTCTWAKKNCEATTACNILLEDVFVACDAGPLCNRTNCMKAIRNFYHLGNPDKTFDVAFCNCQHDDESCILTQRRLHPVCAITMPSYMPGCDEVAEACKRREDCKHRLQRFEDACAVNRHTFKCQSSPRACREALVGILGTPMRTSCGCSGNNIISLYKCTDWQRIIWLNPCVVQSQREFLEHRMNTIPQAPTIMVPPPNTIKAPNNVNNGYHSNYSPPQGHNSMGTTPTYAVPTKIAPPSTSTQYCLLHGKDSVPLTIRYGTGRRVYNKEDPDCSSICTCDKEGELACKVLPCDARISCATSYAVYTHLNPSYQAYRGRCICYSGKFICMKPMPQLYTLRPGVFLFLGYSELEERLLSSHTQITIMNSIKRIQEVMDESQENNSGAICKLQLYKHVGENIVMQAYLEEFDDERKNSSMTENMVLKEKDHCYNSLKNLTDLINSKDPLIRNDVPMSLIKLSEVDVLLKEPTNGVSVYSSRRLHHFYLTSVTFLLIISSLLTL